MYHCCRFLKEETTEPCCSGLETIYDQTESEDQVPWCLMACRETLELKAKEAPHLLKQWNVCEEGSSPRYDTMVESCFRTLLWVMGSTLGPCGIANKGELRGRGIFWNMTYRVEMRHRGDAPRAGIWMVANWDCFCSDLDHFKMTVAKPG